MKNVGVNEILCWSSIDIITMDICMLEKNINNENIAYFYQIWLYSRRFFLLLVKNSSKKFELTALNRKDSICYYDIEIKT